MTLYYAHSAQDCVSIKPDQGSYYKGKDKDCLWILGGGEHPRVGVYGERFFKALRIFVRHGGDIDRPR